MAKYEYNDESIPNTYAISKLLGMLFKNKQFDLEEIPEEVIKYFKEII